MELAGADTLGEDHGEPAWPTAYTIVSTLLWVLKNEINLSSKKEIEGKDQVFQQSQKESIAEIFS